MRIKAIIFCIALITSFSSCKPSNRLEDYIYYRLNANPSTLDPALIVDVSSASIASKLFNGLVKLNSNLEVIPDIAERWEVSKDGLRYRFYLKQKVRFLSGWEVKAHDFKYSFERVLDPKTKSPNTWVFDKVEGAKEFQRGLAKEVKGFKIIDDYSLEIRLKKPFSPFLSMLTMTPAYVIQKEDAEKKRNDFSTYLIGTGPFVLRKWLPNRELILERNEDYFDKKARLKGIVYKIIPEDLTTITEFELGNIDVISLPASAYSKFKNDKQWDKNILSLEGLNTYYLGLNSSRPPFNNINLRKAISYAIDRERILNTFYEKRGRLAAGPVPDLMRRWDLKVSINYAPEIAKEIIKKEGLSGIRVNMYVTADQDVVDLAEIIQSYLSDVGINVSIKQLEWSAYKDAINKGEPDMFWLSWWADYPDPENFLFPLFHSSNLGPAGNRTRYVNREVDTLIEKGQNSFSERVRNKFYMEAENIIVRDLPWIPFWHRTDFIVKQPWVKDYKVYPIYTMDKGVDVSIER